MSYHHKVSRIMYRFVGQVLQIESRDKKKIHTTNSNCQKYYYFSDLTYLECNSCDKPGTAVNNSVHSREK